MEERRLAELAIRDRQLDPIAELPELLRVELLGLVRDVARLGPGPERPALDGLGQDHGGLVLGLDRGPVGRVDLAVVVPAAPQPLDGVVAQGLDDLERARILAEEVLADVAALSIAKRCHSPSSVSFMISTSAPS